MNEKGTKIGRGKGHVIKNNRCECGRWIRGGGEKCSLCRKGETPSLYKMDKCECGGEKSKDAQRCRECSTKYRRTRTKFCNTCGDELTGGNWTAGAKNNHQNKCRKCDNEEQRRINDANKEKNEIKRYKVKAETMAAYGGKCACCGESETAFLTIDHRLGGGATHRKTAGRKFVFYTWLRKQGYPQDEYQCLCMNCNFAKSKNPGGCPHHITEEQIERKSAEERGHQKTCDICDIKFSTATGLGNHNNRYHSSKTK